MANTELTQSEIGADRLGTAGDDIYAALMAAHDGLDFEASAAFNARLVLLLANELGDADRVLAAIERAIQTSDLGLMPNSDGNVIHLPVPALTEERRLEYVKLIKKLGEDGKIGIRNVRREMNERIKSEEKAHRLSEDESKRHQKTIQDLTDQHTSSIDSAISVKEQEILEI